MARDRDIVDKYSGGGTGNWKRAPKKAEPKKAEKKKRGVATTEAAKKVLRKKDKAKRVKEDTTKNPPSTAAGGGPRKKPAKPQNRSGDAVLGMGPNDAAAKKMNRQPGYEPIKRTQKKPQTVTRGNIGRTSSGKTSQEKATKKSNPRNKRSKAS